jgi:hypothetical protein
LVCGNEAGRITILFYTHDLLDVLVCGNEAGRITILFYNNLANKDSKI